ncbi:MAG: ABC transporter permease [Parachlamydia sp.]|jgi:ABC-2 type transport system permease protein|nr:ABC transporter permease [Parachlamydia sp.]
MHNSSLRRILALIVKESYQIVRDPSSILISFFLPMMLLFLYSFGVSLDVNHINLGIVLEDTAPDAISFAQSLQDSRYFETLVVKDRRLMEREIVKGSIRGFVVIPSYFSSFRERPSSIAPIQIITDGSEPNTASFVQNYVQAAWQNWLQQQSISNKLQGLPLVRTQARIWFNEELQSSYFLIPGSLAIIMTLIGTLLTALVVAKEWERGTMEALMSTPVSINELLIGKLVPYFVLGMMAMTLCVLISVFLLGIPLRGTWPVLGLVTAVFLWTALGVGLLISTLAKNQFVAAQAAIIASFLPAFILSDFIFEISSMPLIIQYVTYLLPARYFVSSLKTLFLVGNLWDVLLPNLFAMLLLGTVVYFITSGKTVKRLD